MRSIYQGLLDLFININMEMPKKLLDTGCGTGGMLRYLKKYGFVIGSDVSMTALEFCRKRGETHLVLSNSLRLPFQNNSLDVITAFGVIEHLDDDTTMLKELYRVCKPEGRLFILTSAFQFLWSYHDDANEHKRRYTRGGLSDRVGQSGFRIEKICYVNTFLFPVILLIRLIQKIFYNNRKLDKVKRDIITPPFGINKLLTYILQLEARLIRRRDLPFGVSLICVAQK